MDRPNLKRLAITGVLSLPFDTCFELYPRAIEAPLGEDAVDFGRRLKRCHESLGPFAAEVGATWGLLVQVRRASVSYPSSTNLVSPPVVVEHGML
jgi:hypothetical protein